MDVVKVIGTPLYQWELGRKISISIPEHTIINRVEFSHTGDAESLLVKPREENGLIVADIPNIKLQSGCYINVYLSYHDENLLETATYNILPVTKRPKPSDYIYTETEVWSYESLEARMVALETNLDESVADVIDKYLEENPPAKAPDFAANEGEDGHILNRTHYVDENGVIHKLDNKFIDADWMATSKKNIDNSIVIPEQELTGTATFWSRLNMSIQPGITYDVHINDVIYPCVATNSGGGIRLGNNTALTANNLPFSVYWAGGTATSGMFFTDGSLGSSVYLKVTGHSWTDYNKLPEEFLPDGVAMKEDIPDVSGSIDVTAEVGQTIIVKEVDENGKPTKWEAADYQPRTHWSEGGKVQVALFPRYKSTLNSVYGFYTFDLNFNEYVESLPLTSIYSIEYDRVEYKNLATVELQGTRFFGNLYFLNDLYGTSFENTGEPFLLTGDTTGMMMFTLDQTDTLHSVQIYVDGTYHHRLNMCYFPEIPTIDLTGYYSTIERNKSITISGDNLFDELYEVMRKNEIVRIVHINDDGLICSGIGFVARTASYVDLFVDVPSVFNRNLRIQAGRKTAILYLS